MYNQQPRDERNAVLGTADPAAATNTLLYRPAGGVEAVIATLTACNRTAAAINIRIGIDVTGNGALAPSNAEWIYYDFPLGANSTLLIENLRVRNLDDVTVYAQTVGVAFVATGTELL